MASLDEIMDYIADNVIIEQGESNGWYYKKFANGFAECAIRLTPTTGSGTAQGNLYYRTYTVNKVYPFEFVELPVLNLSPSSGSTGIVGDVNFNRTQLTSYSTYRGNGGTVGSAVSVYAYGKWK